jgi:hypothetical protein
MATPQERDAVRRVEDRIADGDMAGLARDLVRIGTLGATGGTVSGHGSRGRSAL